MKKLIILFAIVVPVFAMAQMSENQLWENARYQVVKKGATVLYTDVNAINSEFSEELLDQVKANMFQKEGIVKVKLMNSNRTIRVYHFDYIELETIKDFVLAERSEIEVMNQVPYNMD